MALGNAISLDNASRLTLPGNQNLTLNGIISGNGGLDKTAAGQLALTAANSYSGGTSISGGSLLLGEALSRLALVSVAVLGVIALVLGSRPRT